MVSTLIYHRCKGMKATITLSHTNDLVAPLPFASKKNTSLKMLLILSWGLFHLFDLWCSPIDSAWILLYRGGDKMHIFTHCVLFCTSLLEKWTFYNFEVLYWKIRYRKRNIWFSGILKWVNSTKWSVKTTFRMGIKRYGQNCGFATG